MISSCPYANLTIYLIDGRVQADDEKDLGEGFLGNWVEDNHSFLFFSTPFKRGVLGLLKNRPELALIDEYHFTYEQWQGGGLEAVDVGPFSIVPPWIDMGRTGDALRIILDPGVVFGTGLHPTTRDCLKALAWLHPRFAFKRVLDIGTGTGILSLAACKLGATKVVAVDQNPLCAVTARRNVALNAFEDRIQVREGRAEDVLHGPVDLIMANIHFDVIQALMNQKGFLETPWLILSGLMRTQAREMRSMIAGHRGMTVLHEWDQDMTWYTLLIHHGPGKT